MSNTLCRWLALAVTIGSAAGAMAQSDRGPRGPQDPAADVPRLEYRSAFVQYRRYVEQQVPATWRDTNETVSRIGGWRAYAREATQGPSSSDPSSPSASGHEASKSAGQEKK